MSQLNLTGGTMFQVERVFSQRNPQTGLMEWFFFAREGVFGPFNSKQKSTEELDAFIKNCVKNGDDGGRKTGNKSAKLSLVPMREFAVKRKE